MGRTRPVSACPVHPFCLFGSLDVACGAASASTLSHRARASGRSYRGRCTVAWLRCHGGVLLRTPLLRGACPLALSVGSLSHSPSGGTGLSRRDVYAVVRLRFARCCCWALPCRLAFPCRRLGAVRSGQPSHPPASHPAAAILSAQGTVSGAPHPVGPLPWGLAPWGLLPWGLLPWGAMPVPLGAIPLDPRKEAFQSGG